MYRLIIALIAVFLLLGCPDVESSRCGYISVKLLKHPELDSIRILFIDEDSVIYENVYSDSSNYVDLSVSEHQEAVYEIRTKGYCGGQEVEFAPYSVKYKYGHNPSMIFYTWDNERVSIDEVLQPQNDVCGRINPFYVYKYHSVCGN